MYYYIVDPQKLSQKEFERVQNNLYSSLSEFRVSGEVVRITGVRTIQQLVENAFSHEAKTIVAVGSEETLHDVINAIGKRDMVIGYIPLVESEVARILGIKDISQAAQTIAFRRVEAIDVGMLNDYMFITQIDIGTTEPIEIKFTADRRYQATQTIAEGSFINMRLNNSPSRIGNPIDGVLDLVLTPTVSKFSGFFKRLKFARPSGPAESTSVLHATEVELIDPSGVPLLLNEKIITKTPATIKLVYRGIKMIVGKERRF